MRFLAKFTRSVSTNFRAVFYSLNSGQTHYVPLYAASTLRNMPYFLHIFPIEAISSVFPVAVAPIEAENQNGISPLAMSSSITFSRWKISIE